MVLIGDTHHHLSHHWGVWAAQAAWPSIKQGLLKIAKCQLPLSPNSGFAPCREDVGWGADCLSVGHRHSPNTVGRWSKSGSDTPIWWRQKPDCCLWGWSTGKLFITTPMPFQRQNLLCLQEGRKAKFQSNINITKHRTEHGNKKFQIKKIKVFWEHWMATS